MNALRDPYSIRAALTLHALCIRCCPGPFRRRFGVELEQTFGAACRAAHRRDGALSVARATAGACTAAVATAMRLHMTARSSLARTFAVLPIGLALAALAGYVDQNEADVQMPALLVFGCAFVCSLLQPRAAWLWCLVAGASIPIGFGVARWLGHTAPFESEPYTSLIAFIPAVLGAAVGVGMHHVMRPAKPPTPA